MRAKTIAMIFIVLAFAVTLCCVNGVWASEQIGFTWTPTTDGADGYRIFMDDQDNIVADNIPVTDGDIDIVVDLEGKCKNFWIRAFKGTLESGNSDIAVACPVGVNPPPANQPPNSIGGFTITTTTVVTPN